MSIDTDCYCSLCHRLICDDDKQYEIPYKLVKGLPPLDMPVCESCFQAFLEELEKKAEAEAAAQEKKSRRFRFFGQKGGKQK